jgi:hypothetical protein
VGMLGWGVISGMYVQSFTYWRLGLLPRHKTFIPVQHTRS